MGGVKVVLMGNLYSELLERIVLPLGDVLTGGNFIRHLQRLRKEVKMPEKSLKELQQHRLREILAHATTKVRYYRPYYSEDIKEVFSWLKSFPILDKKKLREFQDDLIAYPKDSLLRQCSSGSSGVQSVVYWSKEEQSIHRAAQVLWWEWAGFKLGMPIVQTGMAPKRGFVKSMKDLLLRTYYFPAFVPDEYSFLKALAWAQRQKKVFLGGYASSLYVLSKIALKSGCDVNFCSAVSWGDKLFSHYRKSIESVFGVKIYETYGTAEGMMIAAQKDIPYMYIMTPNVFLEILDDDGNEVPDGKMGNVVVTSLVAKAMPLIRYKIGDLAIKLPAHKYPVKRELSLPLLEKVIGRDTDIVRTSSGKFMVVHTFTGIFEYFPEVEQFCVIQDDLNGITINYIPGANFTPNVLEHISEKIQSYLKEPSFSITFKRVSYIPPTPSGKPQIIVSNI